MVTDSLNKLHLREVGDSIGPLQLLIIQATPFCNIKCRYCYLPDRSEKRRMSPEVLECIFRRIADEPRILSNSFTICWHAGEPLAVGIPFYEVATDLSQQIFEGLCTVENAVQTNGTLITDKWCQFFKRAGFRIGLSIDGPAFLHDQNRKTRRGAGTHGSIMRSIGLLRTYGIDFRVIAVITSDSLEFPHEFYNFFKDNGITRVGLNIEEVENAHKKSSMYSENVDAQLRHFLKTIFKLSIQDGTVVFRELEVVQNAVTGKVRRVSTHQLTTGFAIVSSDVNGNLSTFSPELLGARAPEYSDFVIGNARELSFEQMAGRDVYLKLRDEIAAGVQKCKSKCEYFELCGGGAPANKYFENGTMDSSETQFCRLTRKAVVDVALDLLEEKYFARRGTTVHSSL
jgi:uncharacterized protein